MDTLSKVHKREEQLTRHISWSDIVISVNNIVAQLQSTDAKDVYGIPRGGLVPAVMISHKLNIPLLVDKSLISRRTIVVDDILDSGITMKEFLASINEDPIVCALFYKPQSIVTPHCKGINEDNKSWVEFPWE